MEMAVEWPLSGRTCWLVKVGRGWGESAAKIFHHVSCQGTIGLRIMNK